MAKRKTQTTKQLEELEELKTELMQTMTIASRNVIAYLIIEKFSRRLKLPNNFLSPVIASVIFSFFVWLLSWFVDRVFKVPISWSEVFQLLIPSIFAGFFVWIIKIVEETIFISNFNFLGDLALNKEGVIELLSWFKRNFVLWPQYVLFIIVGAIGVVSSIPLISESITLQNQVGIYVGIFFCTGMIGHGTYFALMLPTIVMAASKHRLNLYPYNPVKSPTVQVASSVFGILTLGTSIAATSIMILIFITNPWGDQITKAITFGWLVYIWSVSSYTFLFPHYFIYRGILEEKRFQFNRIDAIIKEYQLRLGYLSKDEIEKLQQFIELREKLSSAKNSPIDPSGWGQYLTSLIFPTLSFIGGAFDIKSIIEALINNLQ